MRLGTTNLRHFEHTTGCVAIAPNGNELIAGCEGILCRWETGDGKSLRPLFQGKSFISAVSYFPDGKRIAVFTEDGIHLIDTATGEKLRLLPIKGSRYPLALVISADGSLIVAKDVHSDILIWDAGTGKLLQTIGGPSGTWPLLALSPDGKYVAFGGKGKSLETGQPVAVAEVSSGKVVANLEGHHPSGVNAVVYSPDGSRLYSAGKDNTVRIWDVEKRKETKVIDTPCDRLALSPKGDILATSIYGGPISLWDTDSGKLLREMADSGGSGWRALAFSADGKHLAAAGHDASVGWWEVATGKEALPLIGHHHHVLAVAFSPDGTLLLPWPESCSLMP